MKTLKDYIIATIYFLFDPMTIIIGAMLFIVIKDFLKSL